MLNWRIDKTANPYKKDPNSATAIKTLGGSLKGSVAIIIPMKPNATDKDPKNPTRSRKTGKERSETNNGIVKITRVNIVKGILEAATKRQAIDPSPKIALSK